MELIHFTNETKHKAMYYNTTPIKCEELADAKEKASSQDLDVLSIFKSKYVRTLTPEMCHDYLKSKHPKYERTPITSIRRSFTNLKNRGLIRKIGVTIKGNYGRKCNCWQLTNLNESN